MRISRIDKDLSVYKGKKVIIWGASNSGIGMYQILESFGVSIECFCDKNIMMHGKQVCGFGVLNPQDILLQYENDDVLIQIGSVYDTEIEKEIIALGIKNYITFKEAKTVLDNLSKYNFFKTNAEMEKHYIDEIFLPTISDKDYRIWENFLSPRFNNYEDAVIICMPPKTGDHTVLYTLRKCNVFSINLWHSSHIMNTCLAEFLKGKKVKIITGLRDPISQNISMFFEMADKLYWNRDEYWENSGNVQALFDEFVMDENRYQRGMPLVNPLSAGYKKAYGFDAFLIQHFFESQFEKNLGIDLYSQEFDKEKGCSVFTKDNIEVFQFQLEKLNEIKDELFEFLHIEQRELVMGNVASDKWYHPYYQEARNELKFSKDYVKNCYQSRCVNHFYSDKDIRKMQAVWESHIE